MSEIVRRQVTLENIKRQVNICNAGDANNSTYTSSAGGVAMSSGGSYASSTGSNGTSTVHNPLTISDQGLLQRQRQELQMQDAAILDIEKGVDRLHQTAIEIGKETKVQTKILDELDLHVDQATVGLKNEAKHAEEVNRKSEVCYMYICIIVEVIVLVILILILFIKV
jgi:t-SNARE complex subunit (syntaxin)